jgi:hypothetical protein
MMVIEAFELEYRPPVRLGRNPWVEDAFLNFSRSWPREIYPV